MREGQSTHPTNPRSGLWMAFAFLLGAALACGALAATLTQFVSTERPISTTGPRGTCDSGLRSSCTLASAGTNQTIGPVTSWCVANNSYSGAALTGTSWTCQPTPMILSFSETAGATLRGTFSVHGPFELFLVPVAQGCELVSSLEEAYINVLWSCAPPVSSGTPYSWLNLTAQVSNPVELSSLTYAFGPPSAEIPPASWSLMVVDTGTEAETIHVDTPLAVVPD